MLSRIFHQINNAAGRRAYSTQGSSTPTKKSESLARDLMALERTYLAWARTSLLCLSLGVAMSEYRNFIPRSTKVKKGKPPAKKSGKISIFYTQWSDDFFKLLTVK
jgi:uncharacterized membrane protein YidH (DUF202 family)